MKIYVRYCGGCNPEYDRVAAVARLAESGRVTLTAEKGEAGIRIAVNGCSRRCAGKNGSGHAEREISSRKEMEDFIAETES